MTLGLIDLTLLLFDESTYKKVNITFIHYFGIYSLVIDMRINYVATNLNRKIKLKATPKHIIVLDVSINGLTLYIERVW